MKKTTRPFLTRYWTAPIIFLLSLFIYHDSQSQCSPVPPTEAVFNGDFEKGWLQNGGTRYADGSAIGIKTDLAYAGDYNGTASGCWPDIADRFGIGRTTGLLHDCDAPFNVPNNPYGGDYLGTIPFRDHTPGKGGSGFAFIGDFNAKCASNTSVLYTGGNPVLWAQDVTIIAGQNYVFSAWFAQYTLTPSPAKLNFVVIPKNAAGNLLLAQRSVVGIATPASATMQWQQFTGSWPSGTYTSALISIEVDANGTNCGQAGDFALDDVSFINGCQKLSNVNVPTFPSATVNLCNSVNITASYSGTPSSITWYRGTGTPQTNVTASSSGLSYNNITTPDTYRICVTDNNNCPVSATVVVVDVTPKITASAGDSRCGPGVVTLTASGSAGTLRWYANASGGTSLGTGTSFTTPSINTTTTYYVDVTNAGCTSARTAVVATIRTIPTVSSTTPAARCGPGTVTLGAAASAGTLSWYAASTGGTSLGIGGTFTTPSINNNTTYYVEATNNGCTSPRTAVLATVNAIPSITATSGASRCGPGTVTLTATGSAGTLNWYAASAGGTSLATGGSFTTPSINNTTTYYVNVTNTGCTSPRAAVTATIKTIPAAPTATGPKYCTNETSTPLTATGNGNSTLLWYTQAAPGGTGSNTAPTVSTAAPGTYSYWVSQTENDCESPRTRIDALVVATPSLAPITDATACDNGSASFSVSLNNALTNPTYQWAAKPTSGGFINIPAPMGTASSLSYNPVTLAMSGTTVHVTVTETVSGKSCTSTSNDAILTINNTTTLNSFTANVSSLCEGEALTLSGSAGGTAPFNYTLKLTSGATTTTVDAKLNQTSSSYTYSVNPVISGTHDGTYTLEVTSACPGSPDNSVAVVINKTVISSQPVDRTECLGSSPTFTVGTAGSAGTLTYKWYKGTPPGTLLTDGGNISGATTATLTVGNITPADGAQYYVEVFSNGMCMKTSASATLTVLPVTNNQPSVTPKCIGEAVNMSIVVTPAGSAHKWYKDSGNGPVLLMDGGTISGSSSANLAISSIALNDAGIYYVEVTTACGLLTSDKTSILKVNGATISIPPANATVCEGSATSFSVTAAGAGTLSYVWQVDKNDGNGFNDVSSNGSVLDFATTATAEDNNQYRVIIKDDDTCPITSTAAVLNVDKATVISASPADVTVCEGSNFGLSVTASGEGTLTYAWAPDLHTIGSNATYSVATSALTDDGTYTVTVSGSGVCPSKTTTATITVIEAVHTNNGVTASDVCLNSDGTVSINPSQSGIIYNAFVNGASTIAATGTGDGNSLNIVINASDLIVGTNTITIQGIGCNTANLTNSATIIMLDDISPITGQTFVCTSANTGLSYSINPVAGADPSKYTWTIDNGASISGAGTSATADLVNSTNPTTITVRAYTINNFTCQPRTLTINQTLAYVQESVTPQLDTICAGSTVKFDIIGSNATSYSWNLSPSGTYVQNSTTTSRTYLFDGAGDYTLIIHPNHPCLANGTDMKALVHVIAYPVANAGVDIHLNTIQTVTLDGSGSSVGPDYKYEWSPASSMSTPNALTTQVVPADFNNIYTLTVSTTNKASCSVKDEVQVIIDPFVHVPNVFSPNGDGIHDVLVIKNINFFPESIIYIYNQWGELIHQGPGTKTWDGTRDGKEVTVSAYYFVLDLNKEGFKSLSGSVTVVR